MSTVIQVCIWCGKFRKTDEHQCFSHWIDGRQMSIVEFGRAQRIECDNCLRLKVKQKERMKALTATRG